MRNKHSRVPDFNSFRTHSGDKYHIEYESVFNKDGTIRLVESGRTDIQAEINSHRAETDMALIISKLQFGDTSGLTSKRPMFGDFTQFPKSYAEVFDLVNRAHDSFDSLPIDVRNSYDNDIGKWFADIGSPNWLQLMGFSSIERKDVINE